MMTAPRTRHEIAKGYGYSLRSALDADFLNQDGGDDLMKITAAGDVILYAHDANAYFVACLIRNTPR